jgi:bifunctional non-homologous end joining protein LigD
MSLRTYEQKRDFTRTPEPRSGKTARSGEKHFVIQKHEASHLHYDFRLEIGGALKSWAVPKGIPLSKGEKRLAMQVEDHPISYRDFEGVIPKGQYGGGTVMVWDYGTFQPASRSPLKDLSEGKLHFTLDGRKLAGEWYLVQLKQNERQWLLIRGGTDMKPIPKKLKDISALSEKSMRQLATGEKVWHSKPHSKQSAHQLLAFFEPMMARLVKAPIPGEWHYEIKYDGFRALAFLNRDSVQLVSRNGKDLNKKFPEVREELQALALEATILDGEIAALDAKGRTSFQLLQAREMGEQRPPLFYYIFDLLQNRGADLRTQPLESRRKLLRNLLPKTKGLLRISESLEGDGNALLEKARQLGLEGLIGKRQGSVYEAGRRTGAWIKLKTHREQEFVIGGYSDPTGARQHVGALLIGVFEKRKLIYCGKVGTGFSDSVLQFLNEKFRKLTTPNCPFANPSQISRAEAKRCHWLKPTLVCELRFSEWTHDGRLRQPVFLGLREDKDAADVVREEPS